MEQRRRVAEGLRALGAAIRQMDQNLRATSGNCQVCGRPLGGFIPAGRTADDAGICILADHRREAPPCDDA